MKIARFSPAMRDSGDHIRSDLIKGTSLGFLEIYLVQLYATIFFWVILTAVLRVYQTSIPKTAVRREHHHLRKFQTDTSPGIFIIFYGVISRCSVLYTGTVSPALVPTCQDDVLI